MSEAEDMVMRAKDKMTEVNAILRDAAEKKHCKVSDLEWRKDRYGAIHVRKRKENNAVNKKRADNF